MTTGVVRESSCWSSTGLLIRMTHHGGMESERGVVTTFTRKLELEVIIILPNLFKN